MFKTASIAANKIVVDSYDVRPDLGTEFVTINVPNGWDDVKKLTNKVITFENKDFAFTGWNSDTNKAYFKRNMVGMNFIASIR